MENILVSIVIPCYNHGQYIQETLDSIKNWLTKARMEVIMVNDGSTDEYTIKKLTELQNEGWNVTHQKNQGLAATRNNAIKMAKGKYIIPLDDDNKLRENYFIKAVQMMEANPNIDIIYGNAQQFGKSEKIRQQGAFDIYRLIQGNYIDTCSVFRKKVWENNGGFDETIPNWGNEDWEFWVNAYFKGAKFHYLNEVCYDYRVAETSMSTVFLTPEIKERNIKYVLFKYKDQIFALWNELKKDNEKKTFMLNYLKKHKLIGSLKVLIGYKSLYS